MKTVSVGELHESTARCVRQALQVPLVITDYGGPVAVLKKLEVTDGSGQPLPQREAWIARLPRTDLDSAQAVSDDRDRA